MRKTDRLMKIFMKWLLSEVDQIHCLSGKKEEREGKSSGTTQKATG